MSSARIRIVPECPPLAIDMVDTDVAGGRHYSPDKLTFERRWTQGLGEQWHKILPGTRRSRLECLWVAARCVAMCPLCLGCCQLFGALLSWPWSAQCKARLEELPPTMLIDARSYRKSPLKTCQKSLSTVVPPFLKAATMITILVCAAFMLHALVAICLGFFGDCFSESPPQVYVVYAAGSEARNVTTRSFNFCRNPTMGFEEENLIARCTSWCPPAARALSTRVIMWTSFWPTLLSCTAALVVGVVEASWRSWLAARDHVRKKIG